MAITLIQTTNTNFANSAAARTLSFSGNVTLNHLLVVAVVTDSSLSGRTVTVTDSLGNTYTQIATYVAGDTAGNTRTRGSLWYCISGFTGANTVTVTPSASVAMAIGVLEYSGVDTAAPLDGTSTDEQTSAVAAMTTGTVAVNNSGSLVLGLFVVDETSDGYLDPNNSFILEVSQHPSGYGLFVIQKLGVNSALAATGNHKNTSGTSGARRYGAIGASFKAASGVSNPLLSGTATNLLLAPRDPRIDLRTRRFLDIVGTLLNSLVMGKQLQQVTVNQWTMVETDQIIMASRVFAQKSQYGMWGG